MHRTLRSMVALVSLCLVLASTSPMHADTVSDSAASSSPTPKARTLSFVNFGIAGRPAIARSGSVAKAWHLRDFPSSGPGDNVLLYGDAGTLPLMCDWDGDGIKTVGVFSNGTWFLRNSNSSGTAHLIFSYGIPGDTPVCGDWNGDGKATIGVVRNGVWFLRNTNLPGDADLIFSYGLSGDIPLVGDWDGNGSHTPGIVRNGVWFLRNSNSNGSADIVFQYGLATDVPMIGDWDGNGIDTIGVFRAGAWFLRNSNSSGVSDVDFGYGIAGDKPLVWMSPNLVGNADFEAGSLDGWNRWSPGSRAIAALDCYDCANHTPGTSSPGSSNPLAYSNRHGNAYIKPEGEPVTLYQWVSDKVYPGQTYRLQAWVTHNGMTAQVGWWSNASGGTSGSCGSIPSSALYPIYVMVSCDFTVPAGTTQIHVNIYSDGSGTYQGSGLWAGVDDWSLTQFSHYNRMIAVDYADMWAKARNIRYPTSLGTNDCTNYLSQMLELGGYPQRGTQPLNNFHWFHTEAPEFYHSWSNTWTVAHWMNEFATNQQFYASEFLLMGIGLDDVDLLKPGDFFLMRLLDPPPSNEGPTHARLIVGYGNPVEGIDDNDDGCPNTQNTICLLANQHTTDRYRVPAKYKLVNNPYLAGVWAWGMVW